MPDYAGLLDSIRDSLSAQPGSPGKLGYEVDNVWRVVDETDPTKFYVRFANGNFVSAYHRNRILQIPDLPVRVGLNSKFQPVILGVDEERIDGFSSGAGATVGTHDHVRNSGREFIMDTWMLKQLRLSVASGTTVKVASGPYVWNGAVRWWNESSIDLASYLPGGSYQRWLIVCINPLTETLAVLPGTIYFGSAPMDKTLIADIVVDFETYMPVGAIWVNGLSTLIYNYQIEDLRLQAGSALSRLVDLLDVLVSAPQSGDILAYNGAQWIAQAPAPASGLLPVSAAAFGNPLTPSEIETAFPGKSSGFVALMDDGGLGERVFGVAKSVSTWQMWQMSETVETPALVSPANGAYTADDTPTFDWAN